jgi:hypothetical protein
VLIEPWKRSSDAVGVLTGIFSEKSVGFPYPQNAFNLETLINALAVY